MNLKLFNEQNEYEQLVRRFKAKESIEYLGKLSYYAYTNGDNGISKFEDILKQDHSIRIIGDGVGQWELVELGFDIIKYSNNCRGKSLNDNSLIELLSKKRKLKDLILKSKKSQITEDNKDYYFQCLANEQFDYQNIRPIEKFNRLYYLICIICKEKSEKNPNYIDFTKEFKKITGFEYSEFYESIIILLVGSIEFNESNLNVVMDVLTKYGFFSKKKEQIYKVLEYYSNDYEFYRNQTDYIMLKSYPIVKTSKERGCYIIANIYAFMYSFSEILYWTVKDYYYQQNKKDRRFPSFFGKCFEVYLQNILDEYEINYEKIQEDHEEKPDWKIEIGNYIFIVEQKSAILLKSTKYINYEESEKALKTYMERNIEKGFSQLKNYNIDGNSKTIIRICLTYDKMYLEKNLIDIIVKKAKDDVYSNGLYWIIDIGEFERFLYLGVIDVNNFNLIVEKKVKLKDELSNYITKIYNDYLLNKHNFFEEFKETILSQMKNQIDEKVQNIEK